MIVVLAQTKGGVGKSTLAVNFAVERSRAAEQDDLGQKPAALKHRHREETTQKLVC